MNDKFWSEFARLMTTRGRSAPKGSSKVQPNSKERYNAQPFAGLAFNREEAETVARRRAARFARWMKNRAPKGYKMPSHIDPMKVQR